MARPRTKTLTEAELRLMEVLWERGPSTVSDVTESLLEPRLAYNTVLTTLRILEQKGYVSRAPRGRAHVYEAVASRGDARRQALGQLVERFFDNSPGLLVQNLVEDERLTEEQLEELQRLLARPAAEEEG